MSLEQEQLPKEDIEDKEQLVPILLAPYQLFESRSLRKELLLLSGATLRAGGSPYSTSRRSHSYLIQEL